MVAQPDPERSDSQSAMNLLAPMPPAQSEHLLKVALSVNQDARKAWAEIWGEFKPHLTPAGVVHSEMEKGFVPSCGWPEFLERFWLLKHYLDSVDRICRNKH